MTPQEAEAASPPEFWEAQRAARLAAEARETLEHGPRLSAAGEERIDWAVMAEVPAPWERGS
jgi:hypothetical protein